MTDMFDELPCGFRDWSDPHDLLGFPRCRLSPDGGLWPSARQCRACGERDAAGWWGPGGKPPRGSRVVIRSYVDSHSGYGQTADWLGRALEGLGVPVVYVPLGQGEAFLPITPEVLGRIVPGARDPWELRVASLFEPLDPRKATVLYTMWETTRLPPGIAAALNRAQAVVVPSRWCADVFSANGVDAPLYVVAPGISADEYTPGAPPAPDVCRFGTAGRLAHGGPRKGVEDVIEAFLAAFPNEPDALLSVKVWPDCPVPPCGDPRVEIIRAPLTTRQLADWYRSLTVYVSASRGEGFGLHPLQAMACGRAVVATQFGGQGEYFDDSVGYPLRFDYRPATGIYEGFGHWGVPDRDDLVDRLREVYRDRGRAAALGEAAARRAVAFSWERTGRALGRVLSDVGAIERAGTRTRPRPRVALYYEASYPFGDADYETGVGGSEAAFIQLARALTRRGHDPVVFARPAGGGAADYRDVADFDPGVPYDVLIVMRNRLDLLAASAARTKVFWTTHEFVRAADVAAADRVICSSDVHRRYLAESGGVDPGKIDVFPYGVSAREYADAPPKVPGKLIYCSMPDRGAEHLPEIFRRIRSEVPGATLHVTADFSLWGAAPGDERYRAGLEGLEGVFYHGKLPRRALVWHQQTAEVMLYPCRFHEFFCIAALECMAAGAVPVTTALGALPTTVGECGVLVPPEPGWQAALAAEAVALLRDGARRDRLADAGRRRALGTYRWANVVRNYWEPLFADLQSRPVRRRG
jgi:glycosyltransferase involved in cell wall biosynthesis